MPAKILHATNHEDYIPEKKSRSTPRKIVEVEWVTEYRKQRDRIIWKLFPNSRKEIEQFYAEKRD